MLSGMSLQDETREPFIDPEDALILGTIINRFAAFFDAKKLLTKSEARILFVLALRFIGILHSGYPDEIRHLTDYAAHATRKPEPDQSN